MEITGSGDDLHRRRLSTSADAPPGAAGGSTPGVFSAPARANASRRGALIYAATNER